MHEVAKDHQLTDDYQQSGTTHGNVSLSVYASAAGLQEVPRFELAEDGVDARTALRLCQDEMLNDGNPALNLASFVTTFMEPECEQLMMQNLNKNFIDVEEYPSLAEIEGRCVNIMGRLFNAPTENGDESHTVMGVSTVGSSEAIILAVLAAKRRWQQARRAAGKSTEKPNLVMNAAVQVCWEKAARYLEVEERYWYCREGQYVADPKELVDLVDENTILVCVILGTTYTGQYEDVQKINDLLIKKNKAENLDVHIHVDGASGGFVAPFVNPDLVWDFRLPLVCSINASGHKYGLVYAGVGWALWRDKSFVPEDIIFTVAYLGSPQASFTLNFSKSAVQMIAQYYQFLRFGKSGYRALMTNLTTIADYLAESIANFGDGKRFEVISEGGGKGLPLVAWRIKPGTAKYDEFAISNHLRTVGFIVPAYPMAPNTSSLTLLRVVVREDFSMARCQKFLRDFAATVKHLDELPQPVIDHMAKEVAHSAKQKKKHHVTHLSVHEKHSLRGKHGKAHAVC